MNKVEIIFNEAVAIDKYVFNKGTIIIRNVYEVSKAINDLDGDSDVNITDKTMAVFLDNDESSGDMVALEHLIKFATVEEINEQNSVIINNGVF